MSVGEVAAIIGEHFESTCCITTGHSSAAREEVQSSCSVPAVKPKLQQNGTKDQED